MSKTDAALLALTLFALLMAVVGLTAQDPDPMTASLAVGMTALLANGAAVLRRSRAARPSREPADELDASQVLDLDARIDALERAQSDAARWRALVDSGQASAPADLGAEAGVPRRRDPARNGQ